MTLLCASKRKRERRETECGTCSFITFCSFFFLLFCTGSVSDKEAALIPCGVLDRSGLADMASSRQCFISVFIGWPVMWLKNVLSSWFGAKSFSVVERADLFLFEKKLRDHIVDKTTLPPCLINRKQLTKYHKHVIDCGQYNQIFTLQVSKI